VLPAALLAAAAGVAAEAGLPFAEQTPEMAVPIVATLISSDSTPVGDWKKPVGGTTRHVGITCRVNKRTNLTNALTRCGCVQLCRSSPKRLEVTGGQTEQVATMQCTWLAIAADAQDSRVS
jgi:hypothetical protein